MANLERYLAKDAAVTKGTDESPEKAAVEPSGAHDDSAKAPQIPAIQQIDQLVGAAAFKEFCHNVEKQADFVRRNKTQKVFLSTAFLFSIPFGCGFSRATKLLAALLQETVFWRKAMASRTWSFRRPLTPMPLLAWRILWVP